MKEAKVYLNVRGKRRTKRTPYLIVRVFPNRDVMRKHLDALDGRYGFSSDIDWSDTIAACRQRQVRYGDKDRRWHGVLCFFTGGFGAAVVAHEMTHAALYHHSRGLFPFKVTKKMDEQLAWTVGDLCRQFWLLWWSKKLR